MAKRKKSTIRYTNEERAEIAEQVALILFQFPTQDKILAYRQGMERADIKEHRKKKISSLQAVKSLSSSVETRLKELKSEKQIQELQNEEKTQRSAAQSEAVTDEPTQKLAEALSEIVKQAGSAKKVCDSDKLARIEARLEMIEALMVKNYAILSRIASDFGLKLEEEPTPVVAEVQEQSSASSKKRTPKITIIGAKGEQKHHLAKKLANTDVELDFLTATEAKGKKVSLTGNYILWIDYIKHSVSGRYKKSGKNVVEVSGGLEALANATRKLVEKLSS